jgi:tetratricopeptide (TPR) repeat protein
VLGRWHQVLADVSLIKRTLGQLIYGKLPESTNEEAVTCFEKAIELDPHFANAYQELGNYHAGYGNDPETAMVYFKKAEQLRQTSNNSAQARS